MRRRTCYVVMAIVTLVASSWAQKQNSDWQVVKNLAPGTQISVQVGRFAPALKCHLEDVTDDSLTCAQGWPFPMRAITYTRERIRAVRVAHNTALIGLAVGAGTGFVIGLAQDPRPGLGRGGDAVVSAGLLGLLGAGLGGILSPLFPGRVIYRAPGKTPAPQPAKSEPSRPPDISQPAPSSLPVPGKPPEDPEITPPMRRLFVPCEVQTACEVL